MDFSAKPAFFLFNGHACEHQSNRLKARALTRRRRILLSGQSGPSETNVQNENTSVDFVYKRFKAKLHRQSTALVKGFPTPPSSCPTDTRLLRSVYLPFVDPRKKLCSSPHPYECVRKHTLLAAHTRVFVCPPVATLEGSWATTNVRDRAQVRI